jgi:hypothetical protein
MEMFGLFAGFDAFFQVVDVHIGCDEMQQIPYMRLMPVIERVSIVHIYRDIQRQTEREDEQQAARHDAVFERSSYLIHGDRLLWHSSQRLEICL